MHRPGRVVVSVLAYQTFCLGLICAERSLASLAIKYIHAAFFLFLQNLALELGFGQRCQLEM